MVIGEVNIDASAGFILKADATGHKGISSLISEAGAAITANGSLLCGGAIPTLTLANGSISDTGDLYLNTGWTIKSTGHLLSGTDGTGAYNIITNGQLNALGGAVVGGAELGGYVGSNNHKMQINATDTTTPLMISGGSGAFEVWKDSTPSKAVAIGMARPGLSISDDFVVSTWTPWTEVFRIANTTGFATFRGSIKISGNIIQDTGNLPVLTFDGFQNISAGGNISIPTGDAYQINSVDVLKEVNTGSLVIGSGADAGTGDYCFFAATDAGGAGNVTGTSNFCAGYRAGYNITSGARNFFAGDRAGQANTTGQSNVAIGVRALEANQASNQNVAIGRQALLVSNGGVDNIAIGAYSQVAITTGDYNIAIGTQSLYATQTGAGNVAIGYKALITNTASYNTAVGYYALYWNSSGLYNSALGRSALQNMTTGDYSVGMGYEAGAKQQTGSNNVCIGYQAGSAAANRNYSGNVYIGYQSGYAATSSNRLIIENSNDITTPLIDGDFSGDTLTFNAATTITGVLQLDGDQINDSGGSAALTFNGSQVATFPNAPFITTIKSGATQVGAGAAANEIWKTSGHATLPDNTLMIGV